MIIGKDIETAKVVVKTLLLRYTILPTPACGRGPPAILVQDSLYHAYAQER